QPLPDRRRADRDRRTAVPLRPEPRQFLRPGAAALDKAGDRDAVIAPVDQPAVQLLLLVPAEFGQTTVQRMRIITAVAFGMGIEVAGLDPGERVGHLGIGDQVLAAHLYRIDAEFPGRQLDQPLAEEAALIAAGRAVGAG